MPSLVWVTDLRPALNVVNQSVFSKACWVWSPGAHTSYDKCSFGGYKLNYSDSEALAGMRKRSLVCVLLSILHAERQWQQQRRSRGHHPSSCAAWNSSAFLSACLFVCTHTAEEIRRTEREEVYFNPDLINVRQAEGRKIKEWGTRSGGEEKEWERSKIV